MLSEQHRFVLDDKDSLDRKAYLIMQRPDFATDLHGHPQSSPCHNTSISIVNPTKQDVFYTSSIP